MSVFNTNSRGDYFLHLLNGGNSERRIKAVPGVPADRDRALRTCYGIIQAAVLFEVFIGFDSICKESLSQKRQRSVAVSESVFLPEVGTCSHNLM